MVVTPKQQLFINYYLTGKNRLNATEAARQAGYKGNDVTLGAVGYENLKKPHIREQLEDYFKKAQMSADEILIRFREMAEGKIPTTTVVKDEEITETFNTKSALDSLGKTHALFTEKLQLSGDEDKPIVVKVVKGVSMDDL